MVMDMHLQWYDNQYCN